MDVSAGWGGESGEGKRKEVGEDLPGFVGPVGVWWLVLGGRDRGKAAIGSNEEGFLVLLEAGSQKTLEGNNDRMIISTYLTNS